MFSTFLKKDLVKSEPIMNTKTIDFPEITSEKIKVEIICNEFTIIKVEKLQTLRTTTTIFSDGHQCDDPKLKTKITVYLDNNEYLTLDRDAKIIEGWHLRETYLVFNGKKYYHNSYCPEGKDCLRGSPETMFSHFRKLRWQHLYEKQIQKICILDEFQNPTPSLLFDDYSSELTKLKVIFGIILLAGEFFIFYSSETGSFLLAIIFFVIVFVLSKITRKVLQVILNLPRKKAFNNLRAKEFDLPEFYKDYEIKMNNLDTETTNKKE